MTQRTELTTETIHLDSSSSATAATLATTIAQDSPRYSFYRHKYTAADGTAQSPIIFIYTCPASSKVREKMIYASAKRGLHTWAEKHLGMTIAKRVGGVPIPGLGDFSR